MNNEDQIRCRACGSPLQDTDKACDTCGVGPESGRGFWRIFWTMMIISTVLVIVVSILVLMVAPQQMPHLFQRDDRNLIP